MQPFQLWQQQLRQGFLFLNFLYVQLSIFKFTTSIINFCFIFVHFIQLVGMRPLERSLEKLDDVRRKKLSEMISGSEGGTSASTGSGQYLFIYLFFPQLKLLLLICSTFTLSHNFVLAYCCAQLWSKLQLQLCPLQRSVLFIYF